MKADRIRAQVTVSGSVKTLAIVIAILDAAPYNLERILKTVCEHFGFVCTRKS